MACGSAQYDDGTACMPLEASLLQLILITAMHMPHAAAAFHQ